jgi:hypothetical protein
MAQGTMVQEQAKKGEEAYAWNNDTAGSFKPFVMKVLTRRQ